MGRKSRFFHNYHGIICMATCALMAGNLHAAPSTSSNPFSQYGLIQGVRNYSSNPFWSPDAPYNMRMPVPVYVNGPDIDTGECQTVVANLVAGTCATLNNCRGTQLSDIRPSVMLALSRMPGNRNYATACMGYIDTAYSEYMKLNTGKLDSSARFPTYAIPNPATNTASASTTTSAAPKWQTEMDARAAELESFHSQTTDPASLGSVPFPTTYADVPFEKRIENEKLGYEPFKDAKAYHEIKLEDAAKAQARYNAAMTAKAKEVCDTMFNDPTQNLASDNVSAAFCRQCDTHDPYKGYCEDKAKLKTDTTCTDWCEKYRNEDTDFCKECDRVRDLGEWCETEDSDHDDPKCEDYWVTTRHWQTYCDSAHTTDKTYWSPKCKDAYCQFTETTMEDRGVCHTIPYCNICANNTLCKNSQQAPTKYTDGTELLENYCAPCFNSFYYQYGHKVNHIDSTTGQEYGQTLYNYNACKALVTTP